MSDYNPNLGPGPDRYGRYDYQDPNNDGRSGLVLLAVLAGIALVGGFLYFGNPQNSIGTEQAEAPIERTITEPAAPNAAPLQRMPDRPTAPTEATPAPAPQPAPAPAPQE